VDFNPSVAIFGFGNFIRHHLDVFLHDIVFKTAAYQPFDGEQGVFGVGDRLAFCRLSDQHFIVAAEGDNGGGGAGAFAVFDDFCSAVFQDCHAGISGS
jgi:hypothetical protein